MKNDKSYTEQLADLKVKFPKLFESRVNITWNGEKYEQRIGFDLMPGVSIEDALIEVANAMKNPGEEIDMAEEEKNLLRWTVEEFDAFLEAKKENPSRFKGSDGKALNDIEVNVFLNELREKKKKNG